MKFCYMIFAFAISVTMGCTGEIREQVAHLETSSVKLIAGQSCGSGTVIDIDGEKVYVLTNAHVVGTNVGMSVRVWFYLDGKESSSVPGSVVAVDYDPKGHRDLALVAVERSKLKGFVPDVIEPYWDWDVEGRIRTRGCQSCEWPTEQTGSVVKDMGEVFDFLPMAQSGRSGSPIVVNVAGEPRLVGVVTWKTSEGTGRAQSLRAIVNSISGVPSGIGRAETTVPVGDGDIPMPSEAVRTGWSDVGCGPFGCEPEDAPIFRSVIESGKKTSTESKAMLLTLITLAVVSFWVIAALVVWGVVHSLNRSRTPPRS